MEHRTPEQRKFFADQLCGMIREWIEQKESDFDVEIQRGVEWCLNTTTQDRTPRANPTLTLVVRINGGAQETEGPPIVPAPPVFRGPAG